MAFLIFVVMIFLHIFADYNLQGILASMKQKTWWEKQVPNLSKTMYKNDYKIALLTHCIEWAFVITLPMLWASFQHVVGQSTYAVGSIIAYLSLYLFLVPGHYAVDNLKANKRLINLVEDQMLHLYQIFIAWILWTLVIGW